MEQKETSKTTKTKARGGNNVPVRVHLTTKKKLQQLLATINKKEFGRKVKPDEVIYMGLCAVNDGAIKALQEQSMSNADKLELKRREYIKKNGRVTRDEFLGVMMNGDLAGRTDHEMRPSDPTLTSSNSLKK